MHMHGPKELYVSCVLQAILVFFSVASVCEEAPFSCNSIFIDFQQPVLYYWKSPPPESLDRVFGLEQWHLGGLATSFLIWKQMSVAS